MVDAGDRYVVEREVAAGGMGVVYQARDRSTGKLVALKLVQESDTESRLRFAREAAILSTLSHPAIVGYVGHGETADDRPYLALEWVEGETLQKRLERTGLTLGETVRLGRRVAEALGHAHGKGIVHRDVKPTNLILPGGELERVSLLDFGIARPALAPDGLTDTGSIVGTPAYMAPEQARGERVLSPATDVFSLGAVLYEALTGRRAFEGKHVLAVIAKVALWDPPRVRSIDPRIPEAVDELVARMLAKRCDVRPADGAVVAAALAAIPIDAGPTRRAATEPRPVARTAIYPGGNIAKLASIVVGTRPAAAAATAPTTDYRRDEVKAQLADEMRELEASFEVLQDASVVATITGATSAEQLVGRAVACARAIRRSVPDAVVAVATGDVSGGMQAALHTLVEDAVAALAREAMALAFAGITTEPRPPDAIRIDENTARLAERTRPVLRLGKALFVRSQP